MDNNRRYAVIAALVVVELIIVSAMVRSFDSIGAHRAYASGMPFEFGSPAVAAPGGHTTATVETTATPHVVIDDDLADLTIAVKPGSSVHVDEQMTRRGFARGMPETRLIVEKTSDGVRIARADRHVGLHFMMGPIERRLDVSLPPGAHVEVLNAGRTEAAGLRERASFHTDNGAIIVHDHRGDVDATSSNGRIQLRDVDGSTIGATTDNGRVELDQVRANEIAVHTDNGRIVTTRTTIAGGKMETSNGRIELGFGRNTNLTVTAHSSNGKVRAEAPLAAVAADGADEDQPRTITIGNGSGRLEVTSDNGSITIKSLGA
ncbi:MAG: hypothetical protein NVSMB64_00710 [Candidatus Velthaea sp.]